MSRIRKTVVAVIGGALTVAQLVQAALVDQSVSIDEARGIWVAVTAALTAAGVYWFKNEEV